jgi:hypothetical protein
MGAKRLGCWPLQLVAGGWVALLPLLPAALQPPLSVSSLEPLARRTGAKRLGCWPLRLVAGGWVALLPGPPAALLAHVLAQGHGLTVFDAVPHLACRQ